MNVRLHLAAPLLLAAACHVDLAQPTQLWGPVPTGIVVAPLRDHTGRPGLASVLPSGLDAVVRARGYRVLPLEVGLDLLRERALLQTGEPRPEELLAVGGNLDVDAVLLVDVRRFDVEGGDVLESAHWDIDYRLLATGGALLWQHNMEGGYRRPPPRPIDATVDPMAERPPLPFGGTDPAVFRDLRELCAALHRAALDHLPRR